MILLGLTGGIASGKSTVVDILKKHGYQIIDLDLISREVVSPGQKAYKKILGEFGQGILLEDKTLDRKKLGEIIFSDQDLRKKLNSFTHPEIFKLLIKRIVWHYLKGTRILIIDAPLLFESGLSKWVQKVVVVYVPSHVQLQRLISRDSSLSNDSSELARKKISSQQSLEEKKKTC
eukprot:TRINITY_DN8019_c0_g1_i2.p1 TRINITY_DN8019_c0_g1~~TRINITY_DN8019_c0_g1_i2.p1  ORF type:complete len:176 (-),score=30.06 TRINITY_DN8019_c0_g1_i2:179-706(-)